MDCSTSGFPISHHLPEVAQVHVHWVGDVIESSHPLPPSSLHSHTPSFDNTPASCMHSNTISNKKNLVNFSGWGQVVHQCMSSCHTMLVTPRNVGRSMHHRLDGGASRSYSILHDQVLSVLRICGLWWLLNTLESVSLLHFVSAIKPEIYNMSHFFSFPQSTKITLFSIMHFIITLPQR